MAEQDQFFVQELMKVELSRLNVEECEIHPKAEEIVTITTRRMKECLGQNFELNESRVFCTLLIVPLAKNLDVVSFFIVFNHWVMELDDELEKSETAYKEWIGYIREAHASGEGKQAKLFNLLVSIAREHISESFLKGIQNGLLIWIENQGNLMEMSKKKGVSTQEYLDLRRKDIGMSFFYWFCQYDAQLEVTSSLEREENWINFKKFSVDAIILINDIFSVRKEARDDQYKFNLVYVKMVEENLPAQTSMNKVIDELKECEHQVQKFGDRLKSLKMDALDDYVSQVIKFMYGTKYWSSSSPRYQI